MTTCIQSVVTKCSAENVDLDIIHEVKKKILTNQQLYCPIDECDFYTAKECIDNVYSEVELIDVNVNRKWCSILDEDQLDEIDHTYDWDTDVDEAHNLLCQQKYFCRFVSLYCSIQPMCRQLSVE